MRWLSQPASGGGLHQQIRALRRLEAERAGELERIALRTAALQRLTAELSAAMSLEDVARVVAEHAAPALDGSFSNIAIVGRDRVTLRLLHHRALDPGIAARWESITIEAEVPLAAAVRAGELVLVGTPNEIVERFPAGAADAMAAGLAALAALPIHDRHGRVVAAVGVAWADPQQFDASQVAELRNVGALCAQALHRAVEHRREVRARRWAEGYQHVLERLSRALTVEDVAAVAADASAHTFGATRAGVHLRDVREPERLVLAGHVSIVEPEMDDWMHVPVSAPVPVAECVRRGEMVVATSREEIAARWPALDPIRQRLESVVALPLEVGGEVVGSLWMVYARRPMLESSSRLVFGALAAATGHALSRARRYDTEHQVAVTLQRSLLTPVVTEHPKLQVAARYLPGTAGIEVGGDFYDVISCHDGSVVLVVGDVVGHGMQAAAAMGQLRSATRALVGFCDGPADLLHHLDAFVATTPELFFATIVCAVVHADAATMTYASAGHPPIAMRNVDGRVELLDDGRSAPLGVSLPGPRPQSTRPIEAGATVLLYTDGLVERRDEIIDAGLSRLLDAMQRSSRSGAADICDAVLVALQRHDDQDDDIALVAANVLPVPRLSLRIEPRFDRLSATRATLRAWMDAHGVVATDRDDVVLATDEALANAIEHGASRLRRHVGLDARIERTEVGTDGEVADVMVVTVRDPGRWRVPGRDRDPLRGRGLGIMRRLCDVTVDADADTRVALRRVLVARSVASEVEV